MTQPLPILMYHQVAVPAARGTRFRGLTVHPSSFRRQMTWMKRLGYRGLSMRDLAPYLAGERMGKVFGITFDDGFRNVFENALPVLSGLGFTSTNYFVANQFDGGNIWDQARGPLRGRRLDPIPWITSICRRFLSMKLGGRSVCLAKFLSKKLALASPPFAIPMVISSRSMACSQKRRGMRTRPRRTEVLPIQQTTRFYYPELVSGAQHTCCAFFRSV